MSGLMPRPELSILVVFTHWLTTVDVNRYYEHVFPTIAPMLLLVDTINIRDFDVWREMECGSLPGR
jgi:hypothetical protein